MSVFVSGNDTKSLTLVFLSGGGTCAPILDFASLFTLFEQEYQIAVVERSGYGFSEDSSVDRDIETILFESREALRLAGVKNRLVLFPHSLSGLESLVWANKYPGEVHAIIGLDPTVPSIHAYASHAVFPLLVMNMLAELGIFRWVPIVNQAAAIRCGTLGIQEKRLYRALFNQRLLSHSMLLEVRQIKVNAEKTMKMDQAPFPLLYFISDGSGTGFDKTRWQSTLIEYVQAKGGSFKLLPCSHYVHSIKYQEIYEQSRRFLQSLSDR
jgi:pimeloyl-ACP methyl ester carboxylesterase